MGQSAGVRPVGMGAEQSKEQNFQHRPAGFCDGQRERIGGRIRGGSTETANFDFRDMAHTRERWSNSSSTSCEEEGGRQQETEKPKYVWTFDGEDVVRKNAFTPGSAPVFSQDADFQVELGVEPKFRSDRG